jgi:hypothetical protein
MAIARYLETIPTKPEDKINVTTQPSAQQELAKITERLGKGTARKKACEACGNKSRLGFLIVHHIIPEHVTRQMGMLDSSTVGLCLSCHSAVHHCYANRVFSMPYDSVRKQFKNRLPDEIVKEYKSTYEGFVRGKRGILNVA